MSVTTSEASRVRAPFVPRQRDRRHSVDGVVSQGMGPGSIPAITGLMDVLLVALTLVGATFGRGLMPLSDTPTTSWSSLPVAALALAAVWPLAIWLHGGYESGVLGAGPDEYTRVLRACITVAAIVGVGCYAAGVELARAFVLLALVLGSVLLLCGRFALRSWVRRARRLGALQHRVLVVGSRSHVDDVAAVLARESWLGYHVIGALTDEHDEHPETISGVPVIGSASLVVPMARSMHADVVFLAGGAVDSAADLRRIAWELENTRAQVVVAPCVTDVARERVTVRPVGGLPLIHLEKPRTAGALRKAKRVFDIVGSSLLLLAFVPVLLFVSIRIWRHDGGPILFRQERIGCDGKPFQCLKFRTMVLDAEVRLAELYASLGVVPGVFAKFKGDPRVTPPGRWLRRFSFDELPQLLNVLRGEMSLVGPRPQVADEVALYDSAMARRLHVRPGMTGLWQVSGRSDLSATEAMRLDLYYVDNWSMIQDLMILCRTLGAVLGSRGAY
jgi:exopolysaccharide biosynthesis polyprenyl glycosylphosphotransferase